MIAPAFSQLNDDDYTAQELLVQPNKPERYEGPLSISIRGEATGKADFKHEKCKEDLKNIQFTNVVGDASLIFYYNRCCDEGLLATASYAYTRIKWKNPYFIQDDFNTVSVALGGFSKRFDNWVWQGGVTTNADIDYFKWSENLTFNIILAGRYAYTECFGFDVGFIALTGMKVDRLYPVFGFDWRINESWKINAIFPLKMSIVYYFTPEFSFDVEARAFEERHRVGEAKLAKYNRGIIEYRAAGVEAALNYKSCNERWIANAHIGELIGGKVRVSNRHHKHTKRRRFESAPYIGGEIAGRF